MRKDGAPRQNILLNVGRIDGKSGQEKIEILADALVQLSETIVDLDIEKDLSALDTKQLGPSLVFRKLYNNLGLDRILETHLNEKNSAEYDVKDAVLNLVMNRLTEPCSKNQVTEWQQEHHDIEEYSLHQYYRAMDQLDEHRDAIEQSIYKQMNSLSSRKGKKTNIALFDTTTQVYYGEGKDNEESLLDFGFSKARKSDLKQIVVGLALTDDGIPVSHEVYSGNTNDVTCFNQLIDKYVNKHDAKTSHLLVTAK